MVMQDLYHQAYALLPDRDREGTAAQAWEICQPAFLG